MKIIPDPLPEHITPCVMFQIYADDALLWLKAACVTCLFRDRVSRHAVKHPCWPLQTVSTPIPNDLRILPEMIYFT